MVCDHRYVVGIECFECRELIGCFRCLDVVGSNRLLIDAISSGKLAHVQGDSFENVEAFFVMLVVNVSLEMILTRLL